jgi:hypothetical protein
MTPFVVAHELPAYPNSRFIIHGAKVEHEPVEAEVGGHTYAAPVPKNLMEPAVVYP